MSSLNLQVMHLKSFPTTTIPSPSCTICDSKLPCAAGKASWQSLFHCCGGQETNWIDRRLIQKNPGRSSTTNSNSFSISSSLGTSKGQVSCKVGCPQAQDHQRRHHALTRDLQKTCACSFHFSFSHSSVARVRARKSTTKVFILVDFILVFQLWYVQWKSYIEDYCT